MGSFPLFPSWKRSNIVLVIGKKKMKLLLTLSFCVLLFAVLDNNMVECYLKRAFNPKLSHVYDARNQRMPQTASKRASDAPINLSNVETLLSGIMDDLDTILEEWEGNPPRSVGNRLSGVSSGSHDALKHDTEWLRAALSTCKMMSTFKYRE